MADYRLYFRGEDGHFRHIVELDCESDEEAVRTVAKHADGRDMELWQRGRLVKGFAGGPTAR
jgi:hypothetical protein